MTEILSRRRLNRATLARQYLLERAPTRAVDAIEKIAGMQCQAPLAPYVGLWARVRDFTADELSTLIGERQVVRMHLMRNTLHLVSARNSLAWAPLFDPLRTADFNTRFGRGAQSVDREALISVARCLLRERPRTRDELARMLAAHWPGADPRALAYATHQIGLCQVPPRGIWGRNGPATWAPLESWLGEQPRAGTLDALVCRYLGAFGPASVADVQAWSGLTRLGEVMERLPLRTFQTSSGRLVYDLPEAPRPPEDTPCPPRLLPEYDNLLLSHKDRTRVIPNGRPVPLPPGNGATAGTVLLDGFWQGTWHIQDGALCINSFTRLRRVERKGLLDEAARLCAFVDPRADNDIILREPSRLLTSGRSTRARRTCRSARGTLSQGNLARLGQSEGLARTT